ncbi:MAG: MotA/TolQ/ExbB proton channel family protein [Paracoccaceae bacterium]
MRHPIRSKIAILAALISLASSSLLMAQEAAPKHEITAPLITAPQTTAPQITAPTFAQPAAPSIQSPKAANNAQTSMNAGSAPNPTNPPIAAVPRTLDRAQKFLETGGPAIWTIAALSVITLAIILWKTWRLILAGAWSRRVSGQAIAAWEAGDTQRAQALVGARRGLRSRFCAAMMRAAISRPEPAAREDATRTARELLASAATGLRALELIATIAPLLGLLGTVLGMIAAFQALQEAGSRADPALLAGGIWEALLTTAAGMAVAIPASVALTYFETVIDRLRQDMESFAARIFVHQAGMVAPSQTALSPNAPVQAAPQGEALAAQ